MFVWGFRVPCGDSIIHKTMQPRAKQSSTEVVLLDETPEKTTEEICARLAAVGVPKVVSEENHRKRKAWVAKCNAGSGGFNAVRGSQ